MASAAADETLNYETTPEWGETVAERTGGVDHAVEVGGVGSREMFDRMNRAIAANGIEPVFDRTFGFDEVREAYRYLDSGAHKGRVVVTVE